MLFCYCMILSGIFFVLSGLLTEDRRIQTFWTCGLLAIGVLSALPEWNIGYFIQINWGWAGTLLLCALMMTWMKGLRGESVLYVCAVGLLLWAAGQYVPALNGWQIRTAWCLLLSLFLASTHWQASFLAVWSYAVAHLLYHIMEQDLELAFFHFGAPEEFSGLILCLLLPVLIRSLYFAWQRRGFHGKPA